MRSLIPFGSTSLFPADVDRLFDDFLGRPLAHPTASNGPRIHLDLHETEDAYEVTAEVPGVAREDLDLTITADLLTISGEKKREHESEGYLERVYGRFERRIQLPVPIDPERATAESKDGVVHVRLPKADAVRARRLEIGG